MKNSGRYFAKDDTVGNGCLNKPQDVTYAFYLEVISENPNKTIHQIFHTVYGVTFFRSSTNGGNTWTSWQKLATEGDLANFIKTKTINILFNSVTWTRSGSGKYYCSLNFSSYITETIKNVISVDLSDFDNLRETDNIQVLTADNTRFLLISNTNSFATTGSGIYIRINYI